MIGGALISWLGWLTTSPIMRDWMCEQAGANPNTATRVQRTAIGEAIAGGHLDVVEALLGGGAGTDLCFFFFFFFFFVGGGWGCEEGDLVSEKKNHVSHCLFSLGWLHWTSDVCGRSQLRQESEGFVSSHACVQGERPLLAVIWIAGLVWRSGRWKGHTHARAHAFQPPEPP